MDLPSGGPGDFADLLAVVFGDGGEAAAFEIGGRGDPDVVRAAFLDEPGDFAAGGGGGERGGEGSVEVLVDAGGGQG